MTDYMNDITTTATPRRDPNRMNNMEMGDMDMGAMVWKGYFVLFYGHVILLNVLSHYVFRHREI